MKDLSIDIVKDNKYFLKSPFNGQLVLFYVEENDYVKKDQTVAVMKTDHGYIDVESDFSGIVSKVNVKLNDDVEKLQDLIVVEVKDDAASDYDIIYTFQQEAFPRFIYNDTAKILMGLAHEEGEFVFYLLSMFYENYGTEIPFTGEDFIISEARGDNDIVLIGISWPRLDAPLLTLRSYILIDTVKEEIGYFTCEKGVDDALRMSFIVPIADDLKRFDYGTVPDDIALEQKKVVGSFSSYLNPKKKKKSN